jgi:type I restriction enzyme S subunit
MISNWQLKTLGDVCEFYNGQAHEKVIDENGKYKVINSKFVSSNAEIVKKTNSMLSPLHKGDIVMVMSDVPNGKALSKCFLVDKDNTFSLNQRICAIRSKNFDTKFLYYQLNRNRYFLEFDNGENQTNLRKNDILNCPLLIPPVPEQKRIVKIVDEDFAAIDNAKANAGKNLQNSRELFDSYLNKVFANPGKDWQEKTLKDAFIIKPPKKEAKEKLKETDTVTFLPMEDLGILNRNIVPTKERELKEVHGSYTYFAENDVLLAKITPCFENGKLGIARNLTNGIGFGSSEYVVFRCIGDIVADYLYYFLSRSRFRVEGKKLMSGAVGHKRVSKDYISDCKIPYPKKSMQRNIISNFNKLSAETKKLEAIYQQKLTDLEELKKSILQKAFDGKL